MESKRNNSGHLKTALITGITGQDGSYLTEHLKKVGKYRIVGLSRDFPEDKNAWCLENNVVAMISNPNLFIDCSSLGNSSSLYMEFSQSNPQRNSCVAEWARVLEQYDIDEVYHLAAQTCKVASSYAPLETLCTTGSWTGVILEAIYQVQNNSIANSSSSSSSTASVTNNGTNDVISTRDTGNNNNNDTITLNSDAFQTTSRKCQKIIKFFHASSSEIFGSGSHDSPQTEDSRHEALSPYAVAKLTSFHLVQYYRKAFDLFAVSGILYNHESPRRKNNFVTSKIASYVANLSKLTAEERKHYPKLKLGSLGVLRDWSDARDFVVAMHLTLQQQDARDYVVSSGIQHSVGHFCDLAFKVFGFNYLEHVEPDQPEFLRKNQSNSIVGDSTLIRSLGWKPEHSFLAMIQDMVHSHV